MPARQKSQPSLICICCSRTASALEAVRSRLGRGEDPRGRGDEGLTPLHVAAAYDNLAICQLLLHYGADPLAKDDLGRTSLHMATGTSKIFLDRYVARDVRARRGLLRRLFLCHGFVSRNNGSNTTSFFAGMKNRLRRSVGLMARRDYSIREVVAAPAAQPSAAATPRRRARTPDTLQTPGTTKHTVRRSKTPDFDPAVGRVAPAVASTGKERARSRTPAAAKGNDTPRRPKTPNTVGLKVPNRYAKKRPVTPSAPPLPTTQDTPKRGRSKSKGRESESSAYLTAEESFHLEELEERLSQLRIDTPATPSTVDDSKLRRIRRLKDTELRAELKKLGVHPGPICSRTRRMYEKKLLHAMEGQIAVRGAVYSRQLELAFKGKFDTSQAQALDETIRGEFQHEGITAFVYMLLDPRILGDAAKADLKLFVESIFYIGKGTKARPLAHLIDAKKMRDIKSPKLETNAKLQRIDSIWRTGHGVVLLEISHTICDREAFVREAAFLEAIRIENVTNIKGGEWHGASRGWDTHSRAALGVYLLRQAQGVIKTIGARQVHADSLPESVYPNVTVRKR